MEACGRIAAVLVVGVAGETAGCWELRLERGAHAEHATKRPTRLQ
jgi:hypothetical protein